MRRENAFLGGTSMKYQGADSAKKHASDLTDLNLIKVTCHSAASQGTDRGHPQ